VSAVDTAALAAAAVVAAVTWSLGRTQPHWTDARPVRLMLMTGLAVDGQRWQPTSPEPRLSDSPRTPRHSLR
jgi:hypothetical protein